jgi:hypothetical protein
MPRYLFLVQVSDTETEGDLREAEAGRHEASLPDLEAARTYAECSIRKLLQDGGYQHPGPMMMVMDEAGQIVLSFPFFPACA